MLKRWLRNYASQGILEQLAGLLVGRPGGQVPESEFDRYDDAVLDVVAGEMNLTSLPVVTRMDFGHTDPMTVLPLGVAATIDCETRTVTIDEAAVR